MIKCPDCGRDMQLKGIGSDAFMDLARGIIDANKCDWHDDVSYKVEALSVEAEKILKALDEKEGCSDD